jgi:arsenite/tail-anchored protein-transporting ATPase
VRKRESAALAAIPASIAALPLDLLELKTGNMVGVDSLRGLFAKSATATPPQEFGVDDIADAPLAALVDEIERDDHGLILCMGKGGVGKTTVAAAIAVALASRGHEVLLTTTDPAAHLTETLHGSVAGLTVSRIDPEEATRQYREHVVSTKGADLDENGRAALVEDLMSPCTEEVAVFQQFSHAVHESRRKFVVIDTAPTGHTLLLMDATGSYHREIARQIGDTMSFTTPLMRLQDPKQTKVIIVTLAETTPVLEAEGLQQDLERANIQPWAWVVNNSIAAAHPTSPFLQRRAASEIEQLERVRGLSSRLAIVPLLAEEPRGVGKLIALTATARQLV